MHRLIRLAMIMSLVRRLAMCASLASLSLVAACPCDPSSPFGKASRGVSLKADITDPSSGLMATVYADLSETQGDPWPRSLSVSVSDPVFGTPSPLAGHLKYLRVLDGALQPLQEIKLFPGSATTNSILTETVFFAANENARYDAMRAVFLSGKTVVELETDLAGRELIRVQFTTVRSSDWARSSCD